MKPGFSTPLRIFFVAIIAIIALLIVFAGLLLPTGTGSKARPGRIKCVNNLKNIGLAARIFATDHNDVMPGAFFRSKSNDLASIDLAQFFLTFSNELSSPAILYCPEDKRRKPAESFAKFSAKNVSYFLSLTAEENLTNCFLAGDRNIQVDGHDLIPGLFTLTTNLLLGWSKEIHNEQGDIAMGDGSVQQFSSSRLKNGVRDQEVSTNLLLIP
jgi:hypothetical protein